MLRVHSEPSLRNPVLLCAFTGWSDAAFAGSAALQFLVAKHQGEVFADFDPEEVYSYTTTRPLTTFNEARQRVLRWPELRWMAIRLPDQPRDLVALVGPEPDLKWRACVADASTLAARLGITQAISLAAFYGSVAHGAPPTVIGVSANAGMRLRLAARGIGETIYEGPTGFLTALMDCTHKAGIPSAAVWVAAPSYLPGTNSPKLSAALLAIVEQLAGIKLDFGDLEAAGRLMVQQIDEALRSRPDLAEFVKRLSGGSTEPDKAQPAVETAPDPYPSGHAPSPDDSDELPSAEEVLRDLEAHLRRLRRPPEGQ